MRRAGRFALAVVAWVSLSAAASRAEAVGPKEGADWSRNGIYASLGGYYQKEFSEDTCTNGVAAGEGCIDGFRPDSSGGVAGHLGYRLHPYLAAEVQVEWVKDALEDQFDISAWMFTANLKAYWPRWRIQPFALLGTGYMRAPVPTPGERNYSIENGMAFRFGAGFDLWATERWALMGEVSWVQPTPINDLDKVPFLSVGGGVQFRY